MLKAAGRIALAGTVAALAAGHAYAADGLGAERGSGSEIGVSMDPTQGPFAKRGGSLAPVVASLQSQGAKLVSLGDEGAKGYLVEGANGRYQTVYVSPDGDHVVAGLMFRSGGANVTTRQIAAMMRRFGAAAKDGPGGDKLPVLPEDEAGPADPGVPFVEWMRGNHIKMTPFLDKNGGLDGYLVEAPGEEGKGGKMVPIYVMPDGRRAVAGVLFQRGNNCITCVQIAALQQRYMRDVEARTEEQASVIDPNVAKPPAVPRDPAIRPDASPGAAIQPRIGDATDPAPAAGKEPPAKDVPSAGAAANEAAAAPAAAPAVAEAPTVAEAAPAAARPVPAAASQVTPVAAPVAAPVPVGTPVTGLPEAAAKEFLVEVNDRAKFLEAARNTVWFPVGINTAPVVWMLADPQCPYCHETWKRLKPLVFAGKLQVRVILIAGLSGSEPLARSILSRGDPTGAEAARAWLEGEGSLDNVKIQPPMADGTPSNEAARRFVAYNSEFAKRFKITRTPFLFYEATGDRLYGSMGIPSSVDTFLAALR